ncbi:hypothetical protein BO78DRAFT_309043 [Aspergillus sclerotiicarbonarius CBS 121057]|uniref:Uncharacterized protein n=1 Tax=Aspergillus sclerotiicarbonarius (strain CBS 121057 / IBT 28362) TaxID=1448318 RepID=A0A319EN92_ASPSB|nr:hypothetical protein BO78DRAFT_309043 [Aspergillus sclerotiicarbonarius CBS 121057]
MKTVYLWTLWLSALTVGAYHRQTMRWISSIKTEFTVDAIEPVQRVLADTDTSCYVCSPPCSQAICCHGEFPQCCSDGFYCYCCQD